MVMRRANRGLRHYWNLWSASLLEPEGAWTAHQDHRPLRQVCGCFHQEVRAVWLKGTVNFAPVCCSTDYVFQYHCRSVNRVVML